MTSQKTKLLISLVSLRVYKRRRVSNGTYRVLSCTVGLMHVHVLITCNYYILLYSVWIWIYDDSACLSGISWWNISCPTN